jgi:hypothetical protein
MRFPDPREAAAQPALPGQVVGATRIRFPVAQQRTKALRRSEQDSVQGAGGERDR